MTFSEKTAMKRAKMLFPSRFSRLMLIYQSDLKFSSKYDKRIRSQIYPFENFLVPKKNSGVLFSKEVGEIQVRFFREEVSIFLQMWFK